MIMLAGSSHFNHAGPSAPPSSAMHAAHDTLATIGVHPARCRDLAEIEQCVRAGYSSGDGRRVYLPFADNIELTHAAVALAHPTGRAGRSRAGAVPGDEDVSTDAAPAPAMTDPLEGTEFVERTGVDALAVAVGKVHGLTTTPVLSDLERLAAIREAVVVPLVLHWPAAYPTSSSAEPSAAGRQDQHQHRAAPGVPRRAVSVLPSVLATLDGVALWRAGRDAVTAAAVRAIHTVASSHQGVDATL